MIDGLSKSLEGEPIIVATKGLHFDVMTVRRQSFLAPIDAQTMREFSSSFWLNYAAC